MRATPKIPLRRVAAVGAGVVVLAVVAIVVFAVAGASVLERARPATLVAGGAALAAAALAAVGLARRSVRRADFDRELRQLLEEEAGKTR